MKTRERIWLSLFVMAVAWGLCLAEQTVDKTVPSTASPAIEIELIAGSVDVIGWDRPEVKVTGRIEGAGNQLEIDGEGGEISISIDPGEGGRRKMAAFLEIHAPAGASLEIDAVSADVGVQGVRGALEIDSVSGKLTIDGSSADVELSSVSGHVSLISRQPLRSVEIASVSGRVEVDGDLAPEGHIEIETVSGRVDLSLPARVSARFEVETFSGRIDNDFGPEAERESKWVPAKTLRFTAGGGKARVSIEAFSGRVHLIKK